MIITAFQKVSEGSVEKPRCASDGLEGFKVHYRYHEAVYHIHFNQINPIGAIRLTVDGQDR
jgi:hypothetical protein